MIDLSGHLSLKWVYVLPLTLEYIFGAKSFNVMKKMKNENNEKIWLNKGFCIWKHFFLGILWE